MKIKAKRRPGKIKLKRKQIRYLYIYMFACRFVSNKVKTANPIFFVAPHMTPRICYGWLTWKIMSTFINLENALILTEKSPQI